VVKFHRRGALAVLVLLAAGIAFTLLAPPQAQALFMQPDAGDRYINRVSYPTYVDPINGAVYEASTFALAPDGDLWVAHNERREDTVLNSGLAVYHPGDSAPWAFYPLPDRWIMGAEFGPDGFLYLTDSGETQRVLKYDISTQTVVNSMSGFSGLNDLHLDGAGNIYVADEWANNIVKISPSMDTSQTFDIPTTAPLDLPRSFGFDRSGNILVADTTASRLVKFSPSGAVLSETNLSDLGYINLFDVYVDGYGTIYVLGDNAAGNVSFTRITADGTRMGTYPDILEGSMQYPTKIIVDTWGDVLVNNNGGSGMEVQRYTFAEGVVDTWPPTTTDNAPTVWARGPVTVHLTSVDTGNSDVDEIRYSLDGSAPSLVTSGNVVVSAEGTSTLKYSAIDRAGNAETIKSVQVRVDDTAPVTLSDARPLYYDAVQIDLTASDPLSGVKATYWSLNNGTNWNAGTRVTIPATTRGDFRLQWYSVDNADNAGTVSEAIFSAYTNYEQNAAQVVYRGSWSDVVDAGYSGGSYTRSQGTSAAAYVTFVGNIIEIYGMRGPDLGKAMIRLDSDAPQEIDLYAAVAVRDRLGRYMGAVNATHTLSFEALDTKNTASSGTAISVDSFNIGGTAVADIESPVTTSDARAGWYNADSLVTLSPTDNAFVAFTQYRVGAGASEQYLAPFKVTGNGAVDVQFSSRDGAGNSEATKTATIQVDSTPPSSSATVIAASYVDSATISLSATDNLSGVAKSQYRVDSTQWTDGASVRVMGYGPHRIDYRALDVAGNTETTRTANFVIRRPVTTYWAVNASPEALTFNGHWTQLGADAMRTSTNSTYNSMYGYGRATNIALYAYKSNDAGIARLSFDGQVIFVDLYADAVVPTLAKVWDSGVIPDAQHFISYAYSGYKNRDSSSKNVNVQSVVVEGVFEGTVPDNEPPTTTSSIPTTWVASPYTVSFLQNDYLLHEGATFYDVSTEDTTTRDATTLYESPFSVATQGVNYVSFYSEDTFGNREPLQTQQLRLDSVPPTTASDIVPTYSNTANITLAPVDLHSGVASTYSSLDGADFKLGTTISVPKASPGVHTLRWYSRDAVGNTEALRTATFTNLVRYEDEYEQHIEQEGLDTWARENDALHSGALVRYATGVGALAGTFSGDRFDLISATKPSYGIARIIIDGAQAGLCDQYSPTNVHQVRVFSKADLGAGNHTFRVEWTGTKNDASTGTNINVDAFELIGAMVGDTIPPVTVASPTGEWRTTPENVTLSATDNGVVAPVERYRLNGGGANIYSAPFLVSAEGTTTVEYWATDGVGNEEERRTVDVRIDRIAPSVTPSAPASWVRGPVVATLGTKDAGCGVASVRYSVDGSAPATTYTAEGISVSAEGTTTVRYEAVDNLGNTSTGSFNVRLDRTLPTSRDDAAAAWVKGTQYITLSGEDALSGIASIHYSLDGASSGLYSAPVSVSTEGTHTLNYYAVDAAGNAEASKPTTIRIDNTAPVTGSDAPASWQRSTVTLHLTPTDSLSGVDKTYYSLDGSAPSIVATSGTVVSVEGTTTVKFYSTDTAGNAEEITTKTVRIDRDAPVTTGVVPSGWSTGTVTVHLSATDSVSGVDTTYYSLDGSVPSIVATSGTVISAEGTTTLKYRSVDSAGNSEAVVTKTVRIDRNAPVTGDDAPGSWARATVTVHLVPSDSVSGVATTYYSLDGSVPSIVATSGTVVSAEGTTTLKFYSVDVAGNAETVKTRTVRIDRDAPVTVDDAPKVWVGAAVTVHLTATDAIATPAATMYRINGGLSTLYTGAGISVSAEGTTTITYSTTDVAGNLEATKTAYVRIDYTAPVTGSNAVASYVNTATITLTPSDGGSGVAQTMWRLDGGEWTSGAQICTTDIGVHELRWYSTDLLGHTETTKTVSFDVLSRAEQTDSKHHYTGTWYTTTNALMSAGTDTWINAGGAVDIAFDGTAFHWVSIKSPYYGIANVSVDGAASVAVDLYSAATTYQQRAFSVTDLSNGRHTVRISWTGTKNAASTGTVIRFDAVDIAGALADADAIAPVTSSTYDGSWRSANTTVGLSATDNLSGVKAIRYRVNEGATTTYTIPVTVSAEGTTSIEYWAVDNRGNTEVAKTVKVRVDKTKPSSASDANATWYNSDALISIAASDAVSGVDKTYYSTDGTTPTVLYSGPVTISAEGTTTLKYLSVDVAGNAESVKSSTVRVDKSAPITTSNAPAGWVTGPVNVTLARTDALSGAVGTIYSLDGAAVSTYTASIPVSGDGTHTIEYRSLDVAGNSETTKTAKVFIDDTAPVLGDDTVSGWSRTPVIVNLNSADEHLAIEAVLYSLDGGEPSTLYTGSLMISAQGATILRYVGLDQAGNSTSATRTILIDTEAPVTTSDAPTAWSHGPVNVNLTPTDNVSGPSSTIYSLDGSQPTTYTAPIAVSGDDTHTIEYRSIDVAGNLEDTQTASVFIDDTAPTSSTDATASYAASATVRIMSSDPLSGPLTTRFSLDDAQWTTGTVATSSIPGSHTLRFLSIDALGNTEATKTIDFDVLARSEQTDSKYHYTGIWSTTTSALMSAGTDTWINAGGAVDIAFDGTAFHWVSVKAPYYGIANVSVDGGAPVAVDMYSPVTSYQQRAFSVTGLANGRHTVRISWTGTKNAASSGTVIRFDAVDIAGALADADAIAPVTSSTYDGSWRSANTTVGLSATDNLSGVKAIRYRINEGVTTTYTIPVTVSAEGTTSIEYWALDNRGNTEVAKTVKVRVDKTKPSSASDANATWYNSDALISIAASDAVSGVDKTYYSTDGTTPTVLYSGPVTISAEGTTTLKYLSVDVAGNAESVKSSTVRVDKSAPITTSNADVAWHRTFALSLDATDSVSGIASSHYTLDGGAVTTYSVSAAITKSGTTEVTWMSVDNAGNSEGWRSAQVKIDSAAPTSSSDATASYSGTATIGLAATDSQSGLDEIKWRLDGGSWTSGTTVTTTSAGTHSLSYYAIDAAGNRSTTRTVTFDVLQRFEQSDSRIFYQNGWKSTSIESLSGGTDSWIDSTSTVTVAINGTGVDWISTRAPYYGKARVTIDDGVPAIVDLYSQNTQFQQKAFSVRGLPAGPHTMRIDWLGSKNTSSTGTVIRIDAIEIAGALDQAGVSIQEGDSRLLYQGQWRSTSDPSLSDGSDRWTDSVGGAVNIAFTGSGFNLVSAKSPYYGRALVTVDGGTPYPIDLYSPSVLYRQRVLTLSGLSPSAHTVRVEWTGQKNSQSSGTVVRLDAVEVAGTLAQGQQPRPNDGTTRFEQSDARLLYEGAWLGTSASDLSGGSDKWSDSSGSAASISFTGTDFHLVSTKSRYYGIAAVSIDGSPSVMVDLYSPSTLYQQRIWSASGLSNTRHDVRIEWSGSKNPASSGTLIRLDAIDLMGMLEQGRQLLPTDGSTRFEQSDPAISREGTWTTTINSSSSGGSDVWAYSTSAAVTFAFAGTGFHYVALRAPYYGIAQVSVDGGPPVDVDLYSGVVAYQQRLYSLTGLADGHHTVRISRSGRKNAASTGTTIRFDAADVFGVLTP